MYAGIAHTSAETVGTEERTTGLKKWNEWIDAVADRSASKGHRFTKQPLSLTAEDYRGTSLPRSDQLEEQVCSWSEVWNEGAPPPHLAFGPVPALPPITRDMVVRASRSFKRSTLALAGLHPRHISFLPLAALDLLIVIFQTSEAAGAMPSQMLQTFVAVLPKASSGFRTVGWYQTLFRIWIKIRSPLVKQWETDYTNGIRGFAAQSNRSAVDVVWRHSCAAELSRHNDSVFACILWDIGKCYEKVDHSLLLDAAKRHKYPLAVLRLTIASYRAARRIVHHGIASRQLFPNNGIIAGCSTATSELRCLLLDIVLHHNASHPQIGLNIYIDDIALDIIAPSKFDAVTAITKAAFDLKYNLEECVNLFVAPGKSAVLSNSLQTASLLRRALKGGGGSPTRTTRSLGIDFVVSKSSLKKSRPVRAARLANLKRRRPRLRLLARRNPAVGKQIFTSGILPSVFFDAPIYGAFGNSLKQLRREAGRMAGISGRKKNIDVAFSFAPEADPLVLASKAVVFRFCKEVWNASLPAQYRDPAGLS